MQIKLRDEYREYDSGVTLFDVAKSISDGLARVALCAKVNGEVKEMRTVMTDDATVEFLTFNDEEGKKAYRHSTAHIMAQAVKHVKSDVKIAIGPAIENGFYYDFDFETPFSKEEIDAVEDEMKKIIKANYPIIRKEVSKQEALELFKDEPYKTELIENLPEDAIISTYTQGDFTDLCAGPHIPSTGYIKAYKITSVTGAYWRGDEKNKMLTRLYGTSFDKKTDLEEYLAAVEEAKKRDHNKLGRELGFFTTVDYIGQGLPILLPKGTRVVQLLQRWVEDVEQKKGCILTKTPLLAKRELYKISGHWDHYLDGMFVLGDPTDETKECFALRPMTCPFQYQVYLNKPHSYRDLPMRLTETSTLFRNEDSGEMHGLIRVRQFTISEGHYILRPDQLEEEFKGCLELAKYFLGTVGLLPKCTFRFSQWDPENKNNKYEGTKEQWEVAQATMKKILDDLDVTYSIGIDEAAFYGPKLDIQYKNVYGKEDTLVTIQIDMLLAEKFGMYYVDSDGEKKLPYIIHRTSLGCYERTLAYLIEEYAGAFPTWLSPVQAKILPISDKYMDYAEEVKKALDDAGLRVELDDRSEKIGYKIREAQLEKIPYMLIVGEKEQESGVVSVRGRKAGDMGSMSLNDFISLVEKEVKEKTL